MVTLQGVLSGTSNRAHSSTAEQPPHMGRVAGSTPAGPTKVPKLRVLRFKLGALAYQRRVAQWLAQRSPKPEDAGSSPATPARVIREQGTYRSTSSSEAERRPRNAETQVQLPPCAPATAPLTALMTRSCSPSVREGYIGRDRTLL